MESVLKVVKIESFISFRMPTFQRVNRFKKSFDDPLESKSGGFSQMVLDYYFLNTATLV